MEEQAGLLTRGSLPRRLPDPEISGVWRVSVSPHSGGTVPDSHRVPSPCSCESAEPIIDRVRRLALDWLPVLAWAGMIFALSSVPDLGTGLGTWDLVLRKLAHAAEYAILALLVLRATRSPWLAVVLAGLYAVSDEVHQTFVEGRQGSVRDIVIDTLGATIGVLAWLTVSRRRAAT